MIINTATSTITTRKTVTSWTMATTITVAILIKNLYSKA